MKDQEFIKIAVYLIFGAIVLQLLANTWFVVIGGLTFVGVITIYEHFRGKDQ